MIQAVPLPAIRIVLVEPSHPGNIGAVARAMKNMGLSRLVLVQKVRHELQDLIREAVGIELAVLLAERA